MAHKPTKEELEKSTREIKALEQQIKADDNLPLKPSEKPLKLNNSFENAIKKLGQTPTQKK